MSPKSYAQKTALRTQIPDILCYLVIVKMVIKNKN